MKKTKGLNSVKKIFFLSIFLFIISGCSAQKQSTDSSFSTETTTKQSTSAMQNSLDSSYNNEEELPTVVFQNDFLSIPEGEIKLLAHGYYVSESGTPVVVVRFEYKNTTSENQQIESLVWNYFEPKQVKTDLTEQVGIYTPFDDEPYADEIAKSNAEIHPGATVQAAYAYGLNDDSTPLTIDFVDEQHNVVGTKEFPLSEGTN